jgi:flagellar biosynthetic protein FliR
MLRCGPRCGFAIGPACRPFSKTASRDLSRRFSDGTRFQVPDQDFPVASLVCGRLFDPGGMGLAVGLGVPALPAGLLTPTLFGFLMVLFRSSALCSVAPFLGARTVPSRLRLSLAVVLAYAAYAGAGFPLFRGSADMAAIMTGALRETLIGLSAGLAARFVLEAVTAAGQLVAASVGLSFGASLDPLHGAETAAVGELLSMITLGTMLATGVHRDLVAWLCRSVISVPPGSPLEVAALANFVITQALSAISLAVRLAFPVMAAVTFGHVALGVVGRTAPQLNINSLGFSITILAGGGALYMTAPTIAELAARAASAAISGGR